MAKRMVAVLMVVAILVISNHGLDGRWDVEVKEVHVAGKVLCQDCTKGWNHWAHGATSLKGCRVSVICMDDRRRVVYHANDETDEEGEFEMPVSKYVNGKALDPRGCSVRLVSGHSDCSVATDFNGGKSGVRLESPSHVYPGRVKFMVGPFYFTSPMCDEPDTAGPEDNSGY